MILASKYRAGENEANFGRPIVTQVVGGSHITCEIISRKKKDFFMTRWPNGLPRHEDPKNSLRFPHGLMLFGETVHDCATRLVKDQLGMKVKSVKVIYLDSYVDEKNHWHLEPSCIAEIQGTPRVPKHASEIVSFTVDNIPEMTFWKRYDFINAIKEHL